MKALQHARKMLEIGKGHYLSHHKEKWESYLANWEYRLKEKGFSDKDIRRSRIVSSITQVGVDTAASEVDAVFNLSDMVIDPVIPEGIDWEEYIPLWDQMIKTFKEDFEATGSRVAISEAIHCSALFDIGYVKVVSEDQEFRRLAPAPGAREATVEVGREYKVCLVNVDPNKLYYDPGATSVDEACFVVEEINTTKAYVEDRIRSGSFEDVPYPVQQDHTVTLYEYHGKVPLSAIEEEDSAPDVSPLLAEAMKEEDEMVDAIVIWADGADRPFYAEKNPYLDGRKSYFEFPWDINPSCLTGRGVAAKAYNLQAAQDASLRAKLDAVAYSVRPMIGVDALKLVQKRDMTVEAGKQITTMGDPASALRVISFPSPPESAFIANNEISRMANEATGLAAFGGVDPKYQSAAGMGNLNAPNINRSRRVLGNLTNWLTRVVDTMLWRSVQFISDRYPPIVEGFRINLALGSLNRVNEQNQAAAMMKTLPPESPAYWRLMVNYFQLGDMPDKEAIIQDVKALAEQATQPKEAQPTFAEQIKMQELELAQQQMIINAQLQAGRVRAELVRAAANLERVDSQEVKDAAQSILALAQAEAQEAGIQMELYKAQLSKLQERAEGTKNQFNEVVGVGDIDAESIDGRAGQGTGETNPSEGVGSSGAET